MSAGIEIGAYRLLQKIGEGGMGSVWMAEHTKLGRRAAIKLLHPSFSMRPEIVTRFFNEARAATAIADPGIVQIFDFGNHTDGSAYLVMELLEGETLHDRLRRGALSPPDALRVLRQVAGTLGLAHARGIVHRDLKPENIFLVHDPEVAGGERAKILDFGIAKLVGDPAQTQQTNASLVLGTPAYMSPEQCRGAGHVDQRSDVYALGCVFFALLTKRPPFVAAGGGELIAMHLVNDPPRPSEFVEGVPAAIEDVIMRCLAKDPRERFASAADLANELSMLDGRTTLATRLAPPVNRNRRTVTPVPLAPTPGRMVDAVGGLTTLAAATGMTGATRSDPPPSKRKTWMVIAAVGVVGVGAALGSIAMTRGSNEPAPISAPPEPLAATVTATAADATVLPVAPTPTPHVDNKNEMVDTNQALGARMIEVFTRFASWAKTHAGAPCPTLTTLGGTAADPWGHPLELTCSDQPSKQIIGAISAGPDGAFGTSDDIASWQLGHEVTDLVRGSHWRTTEKVKPIKIPVVSPPMFDENGIPIQRKGS